MTETTGIMIRMGLPLSGKKKIKHANESERQMCRKRHFCFKALAERTIRDYLKKKNKNSKKYQKIQKNAPSVHKCADTSYKRCPDHYIGYVSPKESNLFAIADLRYENKRKALFHKSGNHSSIVIVLESPHISEFRQQITGPALGTTGERIHSHLWGILRKSGLLTKEKQDVYLVNAVQYQCSLGFDTDLYRDLIFDAMWKIGESCLIHRVKKYSPATVIVASTKKFQKKIVEALKGQISSKILEASSHPSVWDKNTDLSEV